MKISAYCDNCDRYETHSEVTDGKGFSWPGACMTCGCRWTHRKEKQKP